MKINDFWSRKVGKQSQKRTQSKENKGMLAHHEAKSRRRAPSSHRRASKGAQTEAYHHWAHDLPIDFAAGGPQGPPSRARGILDKSSNERIKNQRIDLWMRRRWLKKILTRPWSEARRIYNIWWGFGQFCMAGAILSRTDVRLYCY